MPADPYTDPDFIRALYENPSDEVLLAEYILQTGAGQAALQTALYGSRGDGVLQVVDLTGQSGNHEPRDPFDAPL